jgi:hypothetical protein
VTSILKRQRWVVSVVLMKSGGAAGGASEGAGEAVGVLAADLGREEPTVDGGGLAAGF